MGKKNNKLEPNWDIVKPNMMKNAGTALNNAYQEYGRAITDFFSLSGFSTEDGKFYEYAGARERIEQKANDFILQMQKCTTILRVIRDDDKEAILAILNGEFFRE